MAINKKTLSKKGNPYLETTNNILSVIGMHFKIEPINSRTVLMNR